MHTPAKDESGGRQRREHPEPHREEYEARLRHRKEEDERKIAGPERYALKR